VAFGGGSRSAADGVARGRLASHVLPRRCELALQDVGGTSVPGVRRGGLAVSAVRWRDAASGSLGGPVHGADSRGAGALGARSAGRARVRRLSRGLDEVVGVPGCVRGGRSMRQRGGQDGVSGDSSRDRRSINQRLPARGAGSRTPDPAGNRYPRSSDGSTTTCPRTARASCSRRTCATRPPPPRPSSSRPPRRPPWRVRFRFPARTSRR